MSLRSFLDAWDAGKQRPRRLGTPGSSSMTERDEDWADDQKRYTALRFGHPSAQDEAAKAALYDHLPVPIDSPLGRMVDAAMLHLEGEFDGA